MTWADGEKYSVPGFEIRVGGSPLPHTAHAHVVAVSVEKDTALPGMFTFEIAGSDTHPEEQWVDNRDLFAIGNEVEIKMGHGGELQALFAGEITGLEPEFARDRLPLLTVRGYDRSHRLRRGRKNRTFVQKKDSDIAAQIASEAGLAARCEDSATVHDYIFQANRTDLEFLDERARRINFEVFVEEKSLVFRPVANAHSEMVTVSMEDDLLQFSPRLSAMRQVSETVVLGWDPKEKKEITATAKDGDEVSKMGGETSGGQLAEEAFGAASDLLCNAPVMSQAESDQMAKARFNQSALELVNGEGLCRGRADLTVGSVINIAGVGERFSGNYYLTAVVHTYSGRGFYSRFTVKRNAL